MAENKSVVILAPNGRRHNMKVTANTTILQVLSDVCAKHGYNVNEYDLKHHNTVLNPSAIFRFTGLVNNAQLQMIHRAEARLTSNVTIGIQLENGKRLMGDFGSDSTLLNVLLTLCPEQHPDQTVLVYMHSEVHGTNALEKTTLQSLGLSSGRAVIRLLNRNIDQPKTQAHVSAPLRGHSKGGKKNAKKPGKDNRNLTSSTYFPNRIPDLISLFKSENKQINESDATQTVSNTQDTKDGETPDITENAPAVVEEHQPAISTDEHSTEVEIAGEAESSVEHDQSDPLKLEFLGNRSALIFNQAGIKAVPVDELPDSFFDLTVDDAKMLLQDSKRRREELEEAPFLTQAQRQLNQDKKILQKLHKYRRTIIRIQFPDQLVLQGIFGPLEKIQAVKDFIKEYLSDPNCDFTIYTTPPKHVLNPEARLVDESLVPSAIIHYSGSAMLKDELKTKLAKEDDANSAVSKIRQGAKYFDNSKADEQRKKGSKGASVNEAVGKIGSNLVPKWFSRSFKK